jgi:uncharacterized protein YoxC
MSFLNLFGISIDLNNTSITIRKRRFSKFCAIISLLIIIIIIGLHNIIQRHRQMKKHVLLKEYSQTIDQMAKDIKAIEASNNEFDSDINSLKNEINSNQFGLNINQSVHNNNKQQLT